MYAEETENAGAGRLDYCNHPSKRKLDQWQGMVRRQSCKILGGKTERAWPAAGCGVRGQGKGAIKTFLRHQSANSGHQINLACHQETL